MAPHPSKRFPSPQFLHTHCRYVSPPQLPEKKMQGDGGKGATRRRWILKPSTLNKGAGLALGEDFETLRRAVHASPDIREWVLQVGGSRA